MALLKKLFGRGEPAPELQIHPEDLDLVSEADRRWWSTLTLKDCQVMEEQDNVFKVAALTHYVEEECMKKMRRGGCENRSPAIMRISKREWTSLSASVARTRNFLI